MIISNIYNKLSNSNKEDFAFGIVWGLVFGIVFGLLSGLVFGIVFGIVFGLVWGLVSGLVFGLVSGLVSGLAAGLVFGLVSGLVVILVNFSEALPFLIGLKEILFLIIGIIILVEIMFWCFDKAKPKKKESKFWFTCKRKLENLFEILLGLSAITQIYIFTREIDFFKYYPTILKWIGYIGMGMICIMFVVGLFYLWIKLNELKYRRT